MSERMLQVNEMLRREIAGVVERECEFPESLVTITDVSCAPDLRSAKVWVSVLPETRTGSTLQSLRNRAGFIRGKLKATVRLRYLPELRFIVDDTERNAAALDEAIAEGA